MKFRERLLPTTDRVAFNAAAETYQSCYTLYTRKAIEAIFRNFSFVPRNNKKEIETDAFRRDS